MRDTSDSYVTGWIRNGDYLQEYQGLGFFGDGSNRLGPVPVNFLLDRWKLVGIAPTVMSGQVLTAGGTQKLSSLTPAQAIEQFRKTIGFPPEVMAPLVAVLRGPQGSEIQDLSLVDTFFGTGLAAIKPLIPSGEVNILNPLECTKTGKPGDFLKKCEQVYPGITNPFFYPPLTPLPDPGRLTYLTSPTPEMRSPDDPSLRVRFWNVDRNRTWAATYRFLQNMLVAERVLSTYPWPSPANYMQVYWTKELQSQLQTLVKDSLVFTEDDIRTFITITLVQNYDVILSQIQTFLKEKEDRAERKAFIKSMAMLAFGAMVLVAGVANALTSGLQQGLKSMTQAQQASAAEGMTKVAKQFAESDSAFSSEVSRVAGLMNTQAAQAAAAAPPTPKEVTASTQAVPGAYTVSVSGQPIGSASSPQGASNLAQSGTPIGGSAQVTYQGNPAGVYVNTPNGMVPVPREYENAVLNMPQDQVKEIASEASKAAGVGVAGWLVPAAVGLIVLGKKLLR